MKKYGLLLILFLLVLSAIDSSAAKYEFKIIGMKGSVKVKTSKNKKWIKGKTAATLGKKDRIKLGKKSYCGLVHKNGKTIELTKSGVYKISSLMKKVKKKDSDVTKKFADYVSDEISETDDLFATGDYQSNMGSTGAVERATDNDKNTEGKIARTMGMDEGDFSGLNETMTFLNSFDSDKLKIRLPRTSYLLDDEVQLSWYAREGVKMYHIEVFDANSKIILKDSTDKLFMNVNLKKIGMKESQCYYWHIWIDGEASNISCIYLMADTQKKKIEKMVKDIKKDYSDRQATRYLILAQLYEDENIQNRAEEAYRKALEIAPNTEGYKRLYAKYLLKLGLLEEAKEVAGVDDKK
jgi:hypothetical protein